jgi:hypothetical protein
MNAIATLTPGETAGKLDLLQRPSSQFYTDARLYAFDEFERYGRSLDAELPHYSPNLLAARGMVGRYGTFRRADMPVIERGDLHDLEALVASRGGKITKSRIEAKNAKPMQRQIYVDRAIDGTAEHGVAEATRFLTSRPIVTDYRHDIVDGHHRWLSAMLINPKLVLPHWRIELPIEELLSDLLAFSDQRHARNA